MRTYCLRFELRNGYYTCQYIEDYADKATIEDARKIAADVAKTDKNILRVDDVYLMKE